ncbi:gluconate:H+ symporter, GntP family [Pseudobutyrivibrio sp. ACV-2]|uniref:GntP family permease n=1 Tax=Pseudobutyrivibrio sp. ACV-2 TaxID=1520801 RepID=UPI000898449D|nr:SLC13 family permease [Pseudobutyrivibrio sp. ACV-2]SEB02362.1 gluconate:H+ symporter, GntP family [Pseudobutyrivibrio sp. ACV-2]
MYNFTAIGAIIGMALAIILIIKKFHPAYSLILGALVGGLIGSHGDLALTVTTMMNGSSSMITSVLRIMTSGILAGALIKTGAAEKIAQVIVSKLGNKRALFAVAVATMIICAVGVFIDISVITVAPIALAIGKEAGYNKQSLLIAMIGGGKAGNIISPNPNTIAVSESFGVDLTSLMMKNIIPAICALIATVILATMLSKKEGLQVLDTDLEKTESKELPSFTKAIVGPVIVILLLALRPIANIAIDPMIALPVGGLICTVATGNIKKFSSFAEFGLGKVTGVSILLLGTGTIAGIIKASALQSAVIYVLNVFNMPAFLLAPIAGILMAGATASTTAGATVAAQTFSSVLASEGVNALAAGAMIHAGSTVIDSLPHGSFFHATGGSVNMNISERMKLIAYEAMVGLTSTIVAVTLYLISTI